MQFLNAIAVCMVLVGALNLAGDLRAGHSSTQSFVMAVGCIGFGVLLSAIANVGIKLNRIDKRLKGSSDDQADTLSDLMFRTAQRRPAAEFGMNAESLVRSLCVQISPSDSKSHQPTPRRSPGAILWTLLLMLVPARIGGRE